MDKQTNDKIMMLKPGPWIATSTRTAAVQAQSIQIDLYKIGSTKNLESKMHQFKVN